MIFKIPAISQNVNAEIHQKTEQENSKHTYNGMLFGFFQIWISLFEKASGNFKKKYLSFFNIVLYITLKNTIYLVIRFFPWLSFSGRGKNKAAPLIHSEFR